MKSVELVQSFWKFFLECQYRQQSLLGDVKRDSTSDRNGYHERVNLKETKVTSPKKKTVENLVANRTKSYATSFVLSEFSLPQKKPCFVEKYFGIEPFMPRGKLDISYRDLFYAFWQSIKPTNLPFLKEASMRATCRLEESISTTWKATIEPHYQKNINSHKEDKGQSQPNIVVGLSVRSLLDLFLSAKSYPAGSEVIITPPFNVKGMVQIIKHYDLSIVPIDIPDFEEDQNPSVGIDLNVVCNAITELTVVIIIVHPFGLVCTSDEEMKKLHDLVSFHNKEKSNKIAILEDCSECFTGGRQSSVGHNNEQLKSHESYTGSKYADVNFFSFGMIKTSTALGGGIAVLRNESNEKKEVKKVSKEMRRLQYSLYGQQSRIEYFMKVVKAVLLVFLSEHSILCGLIILIIDFFGFNYDELISSALSGFRTDKQEMRHFFKKNTDKYKLETKVLIRKIRKRPSHALLSLLLRRLKQLEITSRVVSSRIQRSKKMGDLMNRHLSILQRPTGRKGSQHFFWLFPILVTDPDAVSYSMKGTNVDVPRGASQLACVTSFLHQIEGEACPNAKRMMDHILYLPITSQHVPDMEMKRLFHSLLMATGDRDFRTLNMKCKPQRRSALLVSFFIIDCFTLQLLSSRSICQLLQFLIFTIVPLSLKVTLTVAIFLHILRVTMGPYYINSSKTFAKFSPMLSHHNNNKKTIDITIPLALHDSGTRIFDGASFYRQSQELFKMDTLQVPNLRDTIKNETFSNKNMVILTGALGFIGSLLLRDLLLHRERLCIGGGVIVICRSKRKKSATQRVNELLSKPMFAFLSQEEKKDMVMIIEGDLQYPNLGMTQNDSDMICDKLNITHIFNCAGGVSFTQELENAAASNITSALQLQALAKKIEEKKRTVCLHKHSICTWW